MNPVNVELGIIDLTVGGVTIAKQICSNYDWSLAPTLSATAGTSEYTIQVSQDNITFFDYKDGLAVTVVDNSFQDHYLAWTYIRVSVTAGGTGTATFNFLGKSD